MTYEEYKNESNNKKRSIIKVLFDKMFTIVIFTMIVIIISNKNKTFRNFLIDDVLNSTMDFSKMNNLIDNVTNVFDHKDTSVVFNDVSDYEEYMDGYKYYVKENDDIIMKNSGIITFIGEKENYGNVVIVQQSNGYYAWYGNISEDVKLYDYIEKGEVLGKSLSDFYYYVLYKDNKPIKNEN